MKKIFFALILLNSIITFGQKDCGYKIDEEKVLKNINLDFFTTKLRNEKFEITNKKESIPKKIQEQLECLNGEFSIANPNEKYKNNDIIDENEKLPRRGLQFLAISDKTIVLVYKMSVGPGISTKYVFIDYDSNGIKDFWCGNGIREVSKIEQLITLIEKYKNEPFPIGLQSNLFYF
ncbi:MULTISPECIES: hypothetical protein [unclassified Flavobacterium]|uniref:hypothetical protein n=1 Tax=unclassified Flavobacterium TaxID=196869 RepID=UPI0012915C5A|nr:MULTISPECIES: hypothetical protein [unclassified Flavobacterium]MQP53738.1 hypothetical protein [Flavobacterium sp. LMO9]MQP63646.1 hypothetical protein [Flavobacterium sp. LMO6]